MKLSKIIYFLKILFKTRFIWSLPKEKTFLIYDNNCVDYFFKYFKKKNTSILFTRGENLCIPVLIQTIFKSGLNQIILNYFINYINLINPKIIITMTDNDLRFYLLKKQLNKSIKIISIQNGMIGSRNFFENFYKFKKQKKLSFSCDYILCTNDKLKKKYRKIIRAKIISIGSFKSNSIKIKKFKKQNHILFLSQYNPPKKTNNEIFLANKKFLITHKTYYEDDIKVLKKLINFCNTKKYKLYIKLRHQNSKDEKDFYRNNANLKNIKFLSSTNLINNYHTIDKAKIVVFLDSFMGYEAFGRGKKIFAFPVRAKTLRLKNANFADNELPESGIFWSNKHDKKIFDTKLRDLIFMNNNKWIKFTSKYKKNIMLYNKDNSIFKELIKFAN